MFSSNSQRKHRADLCMLSIVEGMNRSFLRENRDLSLFSRS
jgi:hypothetical protein